MIFCAAGIAACAAAYIFSRLEFEHECQIDFLYEDRLVWNAQTRNDEVAKSADEHNRNAVQESLLHDFAKGMSPIDSLEQRVCRCREDAALTHEDAKRIERVLSTLHNEISGNCNNLWEPPARVGIVRHPSFWYNWCI